MAPFCKSLKALFTELNTKTVKLTKISKATTEPGILTSWVLQERVLTTMGLKTRGS